MVKAQTGKDDKVSMAIAITRHNYKIYKQPHDELVLGDECPIHHDCNISSILRNIPQWRCVDIGGNIWYTNAHPNETPIARMYSAIPKMPSTTTQQSKTTKVSATKNIYGYVSPWIRDYDGNYECKPIDFSKVIKERPIADFPHTCPRCGGKCYIGCNIDHLDKSKNDICK